LKGSNPKINSWTWRQCFR